MPVRTIPTSRRSDGIDRALLLPLDPDGSAAAFVPHLKPGSASASASSSATASAAPGAVAPSALPSAPPACRRLIDMRGQPDLFGRTLEVTVIGFADEIAAAAGLLQGQAAEAQPVVIVRGLTWTAPDAPVNELVRPPEEDLFR